MIVRHKIDHLCTVKSCSDSDKSSLPPPLIGLSCDMLRFVSYVTGMAVEQVYRYKALIAPELASCLLLATQLYSVSKSSRADSSAESR